MNGLAGTSKALSCRRAIQWLSLGHSSRYCSWREVYLHSNGPPRQEDPNTRESLKGGSSRSRLLTTFSVIPHPKRPWTGFRKHPNRTELKLPYSPKLHDLNYLVAARSHKVETIANDASRCPLPNCCPNATDIATHLPQSKSYVPMVDLCCYKKRLRIGQMVSWKTARRNDRLQLCLDVACNRFCLHVAFKFQGIVAVGRCQLAGSLGPAGVDIANFGSKLLQFLCQFGICAAQMLV